MTGADFKPKIRRVVLCRDVIVVAKTRIEGTWAAYIGSVAGQNHDIEWREVLKEGCKLPEDLARTIFPSFKELPYAH
jgi:hypothetical protein